MSFYQNKVDMEDLENDTEILKVGKWKQQRILQEK